MPGLIPEYTLAEPLASVTATVPHARDRTCSKSCVFTTIPRSLSDVMDQSLTEGADTVCERKESCKALVDG